MVEGLLIFVIGLLWACWFAYDYWIATQVSSWGGL